LIMALPPSRAEAAFPAYWYWTLIVIDPL
jgi:hypothetical protein